jgi:hypothetical protein
VAWTFALIAPVHPVLHRVSCSYEMIANAAKHYATNQNMGLGSNGADWVHSLRKIPTWLRGTNFCINCTSWPRFCAEFHAVRKHYATHKNISLGSNVVDWVHSLRKIPMWLRGTNLCINCTSCPHFATTFVQLRNDPKCCQTLWNAPKHEFMVQWSGLGAFVPKNPDVTSCNELLH